MKKLLVLVGAVALVGSTFAQKPSADESKYSLEGTINFNTAAGFQWRAPSVRARYFYSDNIAARLTIQLGDEGATRMQIVDNVSNATQDTLGSRTINNMGWMIGIGGEYHLAGTDRLSPYFTAGFNFGGASQSVELVNASDDMLDLSILPDYAYDFNQTRKVGRSMLGFNLGAGMDFYIFENVYLGFELGFLFMSTKYKSSEIVTTIGTNTPTTMTTLENSDRSLFTSAMNSSFRLGWRF